MSKRKPVRHEDESVAEPAVEAGEDEAWSAPGFRRSVLIALAFFIAPALVMAVLGERTYAAAWFGVTTLVLIWEWWRQIVGFWRSLRGHTDEQNAQRPEGQDYNAGS